MGSLFCRTLQKAPDRGTDIEMARHLSAFSSQSLRSRFCSQRPGLNKQIAHETHVTAATVKAYVTRIFVSFTSTAVLGPPWQHMCFFHTDALTPTNEAPFTKAGFCSCSEHPHEHS
jgi:hypothetical protein